MWFLIYNYFLCIYFYQKRKKNLISLSSRLGINKKKKGGEIYVLFSRLNPIYIYRSMLIFNWLNN